MRNLRNLTKHSFSTSPHLDFLASYYHCHKFWSLSPVGHKTIIHKVRFLPNQLFFPTLSWTRNHLANTTENRLMDRQKLASKIMVLNLLLNCKSQLNSLFSEGCKLALRQSDHTKGWGDKRLFLCKSFLLGNNCLWLLKIMKAIYKFDSRIARNFLNLYSNGY